VTIAFGRDETAQQRAARKRSERMEAARAKGTHTKQEWRVLHDLFGRCVSCGVPYTELFGEQATKDHIEMVFVGGCDCIANLQPVCRECNSAGVAGDLRGEVLPGWSTLFLHKMGHYY
jgi:hypothetical protein